MFDITAAVVDTLGLLTCWLPTHHGRDMSLRIKRSVGVAIVITLLVTIVTASPASRRRHRRMQMQRTMASQRHEKAMSESRELLKTDPAESLAVLGRLIESRRLVSYSYSSARTELDDLVSKALATLADSMEKRDVAVALEKLEFASQHVATKISDDARLQLAAVVSAVRERAYIAALEEAVEAGDKAQWIEAGRASARATNVSPTCLPTNSQGVARLIATAKQLQSINRVNLFAKTPDALKLEAEARTIVPKTLMAEVGRLEDLRELIAVVRGPLAKTPSARLDKLVDSFSNALDDVQQARVFELELSIKLLLEGLAARAKHRLPDHLPAPVRDARMAELQCLLLGKGTVSSWPFREYVRDDTEPPPLIAIVSPKTDGGTWPTDLQLGPQPTDDSLERITAACSHLESQIAARINELRPALIAEAESQLSAVKSLLGDVRQRAGDRSEQINQIAELTDESLVPIERLVVSHMQCEGKSSAEILAVVGELQGARTLFQKDDQPSQGPASDPVLPELGIHSE